MVLPHTEVTWLIFIHSALLYAWSFLVLVLVVCFPSPKFFNILPASLALFNSLPASVTSCSSKPALPVIPVKDDFILILHSKAVFTCSSSDCILTEKTTSALTVTNAESM